MDDCIGMATERVDLIVVGSGQGGIPLAVDFARAGKRVVLFERGRIGGCCVNVGCTPSKAFLATAHAAGRARRAIDVDVSAAVHVESRDALARARRIRDTWRRGVETKIAEAGIDLISAEAAFIGERTLRGGGRDVTAPVVVLDTGASPLLPAIPGLDKVPYLTYESFFEQLELPKRLVVIGAGYIGLELGQGARRLGSEVTILHSHERVLDREEADASRVIEQSLVRDGVELLLGTAIAEVRRRGERIEVVLANNTVIEADGLLVATGRSPNSAALAPSAGNITCGPNGAIAVDGYLRTTSVGVFAIGDVAGQPAFTHVAWEDYRRVKSTMSGEPRRKDDRVLSYSTFTEPQLARTGLDESQARARGIACRSVTLATDDIARGAEWGLNDGFYRLVIDAKSDRIIGATLVGYEAGEIVHTLAFAIHLGATWRDLDRFVAIHPTFAEGLPSLARLFGGT